MDKYISVPEVDEKSLLYAILGFLWLNFIWELYLSIRQHAVYRDAKEVPAELKGMLKEETFSKARLYSLDKSSFSIYKETLQMIISTAFILYFGFFHFWKLSKTALVAMGFEGNNEILQSMMFGLFTNIFSTIISLPFSIYNTFVLEEKFGFNKQTCGFFIKDKIKAFVVGQIIMLPLFAAVVKIVQVGGEYFFLYLWLFAMMVTFFLLTVYPDYIAPLFDKYTALPEGELRTRIEELASNLKFPLYELYVVEGSKRSVHSNAYFYGFFKKKRIVLFDTLLKDYTPINKEGSSEKKSDDESEEKETLKKEIEQEEDKKEDSSTKEDDAKGCNNDEVIAVLGHELGHWKLNHVLKNIIIMQVNLFMIFLVFGILLRYQSMYRAFGFMDEQPILIGFFIVGQFIFSPYNAVLGFFLTVLSRRFEFQADAFATKLGHAEALGAALIKLNSDNLGFPVNDPLYSMWHHSHPPLLERLNALKKTA
ncbi:CAAX prenyl protease 1 homolog [Ischnura elegans]|uniref:CAAX prenyl protease 1 homolog n=1 Tax=Ischnura elegans TaxID=197161 RepID=UPI001ED8BF05|nr:CAAX prenyl protease 1 homolog [Ischnura elegans]